MKKSLVLAIAAITLMAASGAFAQEAKPTDKPATTQTEKSETPKKAHKGHKGHRHHKVKKAEQTK